MTTKKAETEVTVVKAQPLELTEEGKPPDEVIEGEGFHIDPKVLLVYIGPMVAGLAVGYLIGNLFEPTWLRLLTGLPVGVLGWYAFRGLGKELL